MKQIIILISALTLGATTCNAQFARGGFARGTAKAARATPKVFMKYKGPIIVGLGVGLDHLQSQKDRLQSSQRVIPHLDPLSKELLAKTAATRVELERSIRKAVPPRDSVNLYRHIPTMLPIDTVSEMQDSLYTADCPECLQEDI